jgi:hypothetical protein
LEVIPLDASLVRGSHGRSEVPVSEQAVVIGAKSPISKAEDVYQEIHGHFC